MPVADTDPGPDLPDTFQILAGTQFKFTVGGPGFGHRKFTALFLPGRAQDLRLNLPRNLASTASGGELTGDGVNLDKLGDDTEATNWASLDGVAGRQLTVDLRRRPRRRLVEHGQRQRAAAPADRRRRRPGRAEPVQRAAVVRGLGLQRHDGRLQPAGATTGGSSPARRTRSRRGVPAVRRRSSTCGRSRSRRPGPRTCASRCWPASAPATRGTPVSRTPTRRPAPTARRTARSRRRSASPSSRRSPTEKPWGSAGQVHQPPGPEVSGGPSPTVGGGRAAPSAGPPVGRRAPGISARGPVRCGRRISNPIPRKSSSPPSRNAACTTPNPPVCETGRPGAGGAASTG